MVPLELAIHRKLLLSALISFVLYAAGVLSLHQDRYSHWSVEAAGPIIGAVSHVVYGRPLGAIDLNVRSAILAHQDQGIEKALKSVADGSVSAGSVDPVAEDGIGAGSMLFATVAMLLFGTHVASLIYFFLAVVGVSMLAFAGRFRDGRLILVPLVFASLSILFLTPVFTMPVVVDQIPVGGNRYFSIAAILPLIHICFELSSRRASPSRTEIVRDLLLLAVQCLILFGVLVVRSSGGALLPAIGAVLVYRLYSVRSERSEQLLIATKSAVIVAAVAIWALVLVVVMPSYVQTGRAAGNFWHRAFVSLSLHPKWPFGNLREIYNCTDKIPEGLSRESIDRNGHCVWWSYPPNKLRSDTVNLSEVYSGSYERVMRQAFFDVLSKYPKLTLEVFYRFKTGMLLDTLRSALKIDYNTASIVPDLIAAAQVLLLILLVGSSGLKGFEIVQRHVLIVFALFPLSLVPLYVAWPWLHTSIDAILLMWCSLAIVAAFSFQILVKLLLRNAQRFNREWHRVSP